MNISKKLAVIAASGLATITVASGAFAYFTATGTGSGAANVGKASPWRIDNVKTGGIDALLPGAGSQQGVSYTVTNDSAGVERLNAVTVTVKPDATDPNSVSGAPGCLISWFDIITSWNKVDFAPLGSFAGHASGNGKAVIGMANDVNANQNVNQDACQGKSIPLDISAS